MKEKVGRGDTMREENEGRNNMMEEEEEEGK